MERIVFVHDLFRQAPKGASQPGDTREMLTRKQAELLRFIHERLKEAGVPPSFDEMKDALDLRSKSGIHRLITALEERGFLRRMEKRARALEVLKLPDNMADTIRPATTRSQAQRRPSHGREIRMADSRVPSPRRDGAEASVNVPMVGRIAAGTPIEALQNKMGTLILFSICPCKPFERRSDRVRQRSPPC